MSGPLVSVIVLSYNRRDETRECLTSLLEQDYENFEVVVLDNGSDDGSVEMIRSEFAGVHLLELSQNVGACGGRNRALEAARGELILQVDNDAVLVPAKAILSMVERFEAEGDLGIIFARVQDAATGRAYRQGYGNAHIDEEFYTWRFHGCTAMIRREAIERAGYYLPEEFFRAGEENDLATRVIDAGYNILYAPWATAVHKLSPKTRDVSEVVYLTVRNNLALAWKFFPVTRALALTLWRVPHYLFTRLSRGEVGCIRRAFSILAAVPGALGRRRPISRSTMRIMDALALAPALSLDEMRRLRENPPRTSLFVRLRQRLGGSR